jgi:hypothetical protein
MGGNIPLFRQVCLNQLAQFGRHLRTDTEPQLEAPDRLMQQHSEPIGRGKAACNGRAQ